MGFAHLRLLAVAVTALSTLPAQEFVRIEAGSSTVTDSITNLPVTVRTSAFEIARDEVTQAEFQRVMGANPSIHKGPKLPVENVTWQEAIDYCNRRSRAEKLKPCYSAAGAWDRTCNGYRLPTEAEWMRAAGAKTTLPADVLAGANLYSGETTMDAIGRRAASGGARNAGEGKPSALGVRDLAGNVWEWCYDRFNAGTVIDSVSDPAGPQTGGERVIRGGSYLTPAQRWHKSFRSSFSPSRRSSFLGFRTVKSPGIATRTQRESIGVRTVGSMVPVEAKQPAAKPRSAEITKTWLDVLGHPRVNAAGIRARVVETVTEPAWTGRLLELTAEPDQPWRAMLILPAHEVTRPLPVVIVPFYDVDSPVGVNLGGRNFTPAGVRAFAHLAVQQGMAALAVRWSGENDGPGYQEVIANLALRHPGVTGLGYWVWQSRQLVDWLVKQPEIDARRIGIAGHSLGGKMALYASAFEPRIRAVVSSEPGISLAFSNYGDPWYFGERLALLPKGSDQHELLEIIAPRPFLLIAGEDSDGDKSRPVLERAAAAYAATGGAGKLFFLNHRTGHSPTPESIVSAMEWLAGALRAE